MGISEQTRLQQVAEFPQIATIGDDIPDEEKLGKLYKLSCLATARRLEQESVNGDEDDEKASDLIQDVVATLRRAPSSPSTAGSVIKNAQKKILFFRSLGEGIKKFQSTTAGGTADHAVPHRVRQIRDYATKLETESEEWRALMSARQERYRKARADKLAVLKGVRRLTEEEDGRHLAPEVREMLSSAPDGAVHMARIVELGQKLGEKEKAVAEAVGESLRVAESVRRRNDALVGRIAAISEHLNKRGVSAPDGNGHEVDCFIKDVERWMEELKQ